MYFLDKTNFSQFQPTKILSFKNHQKRSLWVIITLFWVIITQLSLKASKYEGKPLIFLTFLISANFGRPKLIKKPAGRLKLATLKILSTKTKFGNSMPSLLTQIVQGIGQEASNKEKVVIIICISMKVHFLRYCRHLTRPQLWDQPPAAACCSASAALT